MGKSLYIAGIVLVSLLLLALCIWFGISIHNYKVTHQPANKCHHRGQLVSSSRYKAALAGFSQYSMYIDLEMESTTSDRMQFGTIKVCFCGMDGKPHSSTQLIPVTYHTDSCHMAMDLADPNLQNAFRAAYGKVADLQSITYNVDDNTFNIIAKALGSVMYDVTMTTTNERLCQSCT